MRRALLVLALAACGDEIRVDTTLEPQSGTRLKLERYRFEDGTEQVEPHSFYDVEMHARCAPQRYVDGTTRCVPFAEDALYIDAACATAVGRATNAPLAEPTHFVGHDRVGDELLPAVVYSAGQPRDVVTEYYEWHDGTCEGPFPTPAELTYYTLGTSFNPAVMREASVGGEHVAARMQVTDDGLRLPIELEDRARGAACRPEMRADGRVVCAPTTAVTTMLYGDATCATPVVAVDAGATAPAVAARLDPTGCTTYHAVGAPYTGALYEARGETCARVASGGLQGYEVGAQLDLPILERTVEDDPRRRLQRVTLGDGDFIVLDDRLYDSAMRADCKREVVAHTARCLPETMAPLLWRFQRGCLLDMLVAEVPRVSCAPVVIAARPTEEGSELHLIGAPVTAPVFDASTGICRAYTAPAGHTLNAVGPALGADAFVRGVRYGER